ncbi:MAG: ROK family protein [Candidatus Omnitrophica bacterium]|nr:ROK family protein [Candidatus Omnitrophota bacterium]
MEGQKRRILDPKDLSDHEKKNLMILETIRRKGPVARADIARLVDLNNVTVTSYVDQYLKKKVLQEAGVHISTGGRKPTLVDLESMRAFAIGVGLNAVDFIAVLYNLKGQILHKVKIERTTESNQKPVESLLEVVDLLVKESKVDLEKVHGIGIGVPGIVNHQNGTVRWPRGLLSGDLAITSSISNRVYDKFKVPVILDNDANTAVFAEQWASPEGLNVESAVYLYSGSGCGLMFGGHIYRGFTGSAGEFLFDLSQEDPIAWLREAVDKGGWAIDLGITQHAREEIKHHSESKLYETCSGDPKNVDFDMVIASAEAGDDFCKEVLREAGYGLGYKSALITNLLNPELIIIGGGLERAGIVFLDAVKKRIRDIAIPEAAERVKVVPSKLGEDAVPMGAAALVIQNYFISN